MWRLHARRAVANTQGRTFLVADPHMGFLAENAALCMSSSGGDQIENRRGRWSLSIARREDIHFRK